MSEETVTLLDPGQSYMLRGRVIPAGVPFQLSRERADALLACGKHPSLREVGASNEPENGPETAREDGAGDESRGAGNDESGAAGGESDSDSSEAAGTDREKPEHLGFGRYLWEGQKYKKADLPPAALALLTD